MKMANSERQLVSKWLVLLPEFCKVTQNALFCSQNISIKRWVIAKLRHISLAGKVGRQVQ